MTKQITLDIEPMDMRDMYPWQENILNQIMKGGVTPGELMIMSSGRNTGKSHFTAQTLKRMMDDIANRPVEELVLSEGKVYGNRYYCVEPVGGSWLRMETWCSDVMGSTGSAWDKNKAPEPNARWYMNDRRFWFREEKDRTMFILRWR